MKEIKNLTLLISLFLSSSVFAETPPAQTGSPLTSVIILIVFVVIFYLLVLRPQQKRAKEHKKLISEIKENDEIATLSGLVGVVHKIEDSFVYLKVCDKTIIQIQKHAIGQLLPKGSFKK